MKVNIGDHVRYEKWASSGTGYVTEQSVAEGTLVQPGTELGVTLVPPLEPQQEAEKP